MCENWEPRKTIYSGDENLRSSDGQFFKMNRSFESIKIAQPNSCFMEEGCARYVNRTVIIYLIHTERSTWTSGCKLIYFLYRTYELFYAKTVWRTPIVNIGKNVPWPCLHQVCVFSGWIYQITFFRNYVNSRISKKPGHMVSNQFLWNFFFH